MNQLYKHTFLCAAAAGIISIVSTWSLHSFRQVVRQSAVASTVFVPNVAAGWSVYSFYLHANGADSVDFEVVLQHADDINWYQEHWIGTLQGRLSPAKEQKLIFYLLPFDKWNIRIAPDGRCFLNIKDGNIPLQDQVVVPVKVRYRYN